MNDFERRFLDIVQNSTWLAAVARKDQKIIGIEYYTYTAEIRAIAATGGVGQTTTQIQSDSDFALTYMSGAVVVDATGAVVVNPFVTAQITDTGTGKTFFSGATLFPLIFGSGGLPFYLPAPRLIAPNTNLQVNVTNNIATINSVFCAFMGARIYYA